MVIFLMIMDIFPLINRYVYIYIYTVYIYILLEYVPKIARGSPIALDMAGQAARSPPLAEIIVSLDVTPALASLGP